jgi:hypothetical protein
MLSFAASGIPRRKARAEHVEPAAKAYRSRRGPDTSRHGGAEPAPKIADIFSRHIPQIRAYAILDATDNVIDRYIEIPFYGLQPFEISAQIAHARSDPLLDLGLVGQRYARARKHPYKVFRHPKVFAQDPLDVSYQPLLPAEQEASAGGKDPPRLFNARLHIIEQMEHVDCDDGAERSRRKRQRGDVSAQRVDQTRAFAHIFLQPGKHLLGHIDTDHMKTGFSERNGYSSCSYSQLEEGSMRGIDLAGDIGHDAGEHLGRHPPRFIVDIGYSVK